MAGEEATVTDPNSFKTGEGIGPWGDGNDRQLTNGNYTMELQPDGNFAITDKSGNTTWQSGTQGTGLTTHDFGNDYADYSDNRLVIEDGYLRVVKSGAYNPKYNPNDPNSKEPEWLPNGAKVKDIVKAPEGATQVVLQPDGSLVFTNDKGEILGQPIASAAVDDPKREDGLILKHPNCSPWMHNVINFTQQCLQYYLDCLGTGKTVPDPAKMLKELGLDEVGEGEGATGYQVNERMIEWYRNDFSDKAVKIAESVDHAALIQKKSYTKAMTVIDGLKEALEVAPTGGVGQDGAAKYKIGDKEQDKLYYEGKNISTVYLSKDQEIKLAEQLGDGVEDVGKIVNEAGRAAAETETDIDKNSPEYQAGYKAGQQAAGIDPGTGLPINTGTGQTDFSNLYGDLVGNNGTTGANGTGTNGSTGTGSKIPPEVLASILPALLGSGGSGAAGSGGGGQAQQGGGGLDQMMMMLPMMMMGMSPMLMNLFNKDRDKDDEREGEGEPLPPEGAIPVTATAVDTATAGGVVTAAADGTTPPAVVVPGAMVDVKLPDGSTQKVSSSVAQAVNKEVANPNGSDARAAYAGTPGASEPGHLWATTDSANVKTGDVVQWANRTAIVVVTDAGLHYLSDGQLIPLDPHNPKPDNHGDYGQFQGFFHPSGSDQAVPVSQTAPAGPPAIASPQTATPPVPAVTAAVPAGRA